MVGYSGGGSGCSALVPNLLPDDLVVMIINLLRSPSLSKHFGFHSHRHHLCPSSKASGVCQLARERVRLLLGENQVALRRGSTKACACRSCEN